MLEIFLVGYLGRTLGTLALQKGLNERRWKTYTILLWIALEIAGILMNAYLFGEFTLYSIFLIYGPPALGYLVLRLNLKKRPDVMNDWINQIGIDTTDPLPAPVTKE